VIEMNQLIKSNSDTMSSREIADLVGSRHDDVKRTITRLAERQVIQLPPMADVKNHRKQNVSEYRVCKRDTYVIVAQLSPEFTGRLVDRWQELEAMAAQTELANRSRQVARLEAPQMTEAIRVIREAAGKEIRAYHFSNEFDLVNRIALGQTAKKFRADHDLDKSEPIRDHLTPCQIACVEHLQRVNTSLIEINMEFDQRKEQLNKVYLLRHKRALMAEVLRIEA
jgi:phage regulator Rha-like protein